MSPLLELKGKTTGLVDFHLEAANETLRDAVDPVRESASVVADTIKRRLQGSSPSRPGKSPGKIEGHLQRAISSSDAEIHGISVTAFVGVGAGAKGRSEVARSMGQGVNIFEYAWVQEYGDHTTENPRTTRSHKKKDRQRRLWKLPARPYIRPGVAESESRVDAILKAGLP